MRIELDDITRPQVLALLGEHLSNMFEITPPEKVFALDATQLLAPDVTFWTVWADDPLLGDTLLGCGALKELTATHGEVKSMRTPKAMRRRGAGRAVLAHIIDVAIRRGYTTLSLETGSQEDFLPAHALYRSFGFEFCGPFGTYQDNSNSVFMSLQLGVESM
jgi:putative acetyltransferase